MPYTWPALGQTGAAYPLVGRLSKPVWTLTHRTAIGPAKLARQLAVRSTRAPYLAREAYPGFPATPPTEHVEDEQDKRENDNNR